MINFEVTVNLDGLQEKLKNRFALQSPAQKTWDEWVWYAMEKYVPYDTGDFLEHNRALNDPKQFGTGELIFESDPESGYDYQAAWLWTGRSLIGARFISRYTNPLSTAYWSKSVVSNELPTLIEEFEKLIDRGDI